MANEEFVKKYNLQPKAVEILAQVMATDYPSTFEENNCMKVVGYNSVFSDSSQGLVFFNIYQS